MSNYLIQGGKPIVIVGSSIEGLALSKQLNDLDVQITPIEEYHGLCTNYEGLTTLNSDVVKELKTAIESKSYKISSLRSYKSGSDNRRERRAKERAAKKRNNKNKTI